MHHQEQVGILRFDYICTFERVPVFLKKSTTFSKKTVDFFKKTVDFFVKSGHRRTPHKTDDMPIEMIAKYTGLSIQTIKQI